MPYYTRVLSKDDEFPPFDELADFIRTNHPDYKLTLEEGTEEEWESLLLSGNDEVEVAVLERNPVFDGSIGQDEIADFLEDLPRTANPKPASHGLMNFSPKSKPSTPSSTSRDRRQKTAAMPSTPCARTSGNAAMPFSRPTTKASPTRKASTSSGSFLTPSPARGTWASFRTDTWHHFKMDLGDPDHRAAFLDGEMPSDLSVIRVTDPQASRSPLASIDAASAMLGARRTHHFPRGVSGVEGTCIRFSVPGEALRTPLCRSDPTPVNQPASLEFFQLPDPVDSKAFRRIADNSHRWRNIEIAPKSFQIRTSPLQSVLSPLPD